MGDRRKVKGKRSVFLVLLLLLVLWLPRLLKG